MATVAIVMTFVLTQTSAWQTFVRKPLDAELEITLNRVDQESQVLYAQTVHHQNISVTGRTSIPSTVTLVFNGLNRGEIATDKDGYFRFDNIKLELGDNSVEVYAKTNVLWRSLQDYVGAGIHLQSVHLSTPVLKTLPYLTNKGSIRVEGTADPYTDISIWMTKVQKQESANGEERTSSEGEADKQTDVERPKGTYTDNEGQFDLEASFPEPGQYKFVAQAKNRKGESSPQSNPVIITYDPNWIAVSSRQMSRKISISTAFRRLSIDLEATLPKDDPVAIDIVTGKLTMPEFIQKVFGYLTINKSLVLNMFDQVAPQITISDKSTKIFATNNPALSTAGLIAPYNGKLTFESFGGIYKDTPLTLTLTVRDYTIKSLKPQPSTATKETATWNDLKLHSLEGIEVAVGYDFSTHPASIFQLTPGETFPPLVALILRIIFDCSLAVPIVWMLWLLYKYKDAAWLHKTFSHQFKRTARLLLSIALIPPSLSITFLFYQYISSQIYFLFEKELDRNFIYIIGLLAATLLMSVVAFCLFILTTFLKNRRWAFWAREIFRGFTWGGVIIIGVFLLALLVLYLDVGNYQILTTIVVAPVLLLFLKRWFIWVRRMHRLEMERYEDKLGKLTAVALFLFVILLSYPLSQIYYNIYNVPPWTALYISIQSFFTLLQDLAPYMLLPGMMLFLKQAERDAVGKGVVLSTKDASRSALLTIGTIIFAAYLVGISANWFWIPIPFLLALWIFPAFVISPPTMRIALDSVLPVVYGERKKLLKAALSFSKPKQLQGALDKLEKKLTSGDLSLADYEKRKTEIESFLSKEEEARTLAYGLKTKDVILSTGPHVSNWENGIWAAKCGFLLSIPLLLIYLWAFLLKQIQPQNAYVFLWLFNNIIIFIAEWVLGAFFFGYFFAYIRGTSGLKKGIRLSLAIIICLLPSWITPLSSIGDLFALLLRAGQTFLFYTLLGVWAFDYKVFREELGDQFQWRKFTRFGDMPSVTAFVSILLTSAGLVLSSVLTGQFTTVVTQLVREVLPIVPNIPTK